GAGCVPGGAAVRHASRGGERRPRALRGRGIGGHPRNAAGQRSPGLPAPAGAVVASTATRRRTMPVPRRSIPLSLCLVALPVLSARAVSAAPPPPGGGSSWKTGSRITLEMEEEGAGSAHYTFENAANGDFRIEESETLEHGAKRAGTVLMVAGRGMAVRGLDLPKRGELAAIDGPFLRLQLVRILLERAVPLGPAAVKETVTVESREESRAIEVE